MELTSISIPILIPSIEFFIIWIWGWLTTMVYFWLIKPILDEEHLCYGNFKRKDLKGMVYELLIGPPVMFVFWWIGPYVEWVLRTEKRKVF